MSAAKHTPGPWQFHGEHVDPEWHIVTSKPSPLRGVIANVHIASGNERDLADARLIAAAPELLDELQKAHRLLELALTHMGGERLCLFAAESEREGLGVDGATRRHERAAVIAKVAGSAS